jgi:ADP-ribose pyrophosphatase YjhB (NUDIX family)
VTIENYRDRVKLAGILYVDVYPFFSTEQSQTDFLLLKRRDDVQLPSSWQPVCGKIVNDERLRNAFVRQIRIKTGQQPTELYRLDEVNIFYDDFYDTVMMVPVAAARLTKRDVIIDTSLHCDYRWVQGQDVEQYLQFPKQIECIRIIEEFIQGGHTSMKMQPLEIDLS